MSAYAPAVGTLVLPRTFVSKKAKILEELSTPTQSYTDASPKGSVDVGIVGLIEFINSLEQYVTTSSCAGRISVYVEGSKSGSHVDEENGRETESGNKATVAGTGGKGGGGRWLFVSHDPVDLESSGSLSQLVGIDGRGASDQCNFQGQRLIRFKFEPMILHVMTASIQAANSLIKAGMAAGFRESGAVSLLSLNGTPTPMVAIRSMGLGFESIIGRLDKNGMAQLVVSETLLKTFFKMANERFDENDRRRKRFWDNLDGETAAAGPHLATGKEKRVGDSGVWEDKETRRERLRKEGLARSKAKPPSSVQEGLRFC